MLVIATVLNVKKLPALFFAGLVLAGIAFVVFACHAVREPQPVIYLGQVEPRFVLSSIIVTVGLGGVVFAVLSRPSPFVVQAVVVMQGLAVLGRPVAPGRCGRLLHWCSFRLSAYRSA